MAEAYKVVITDFLKDRLVPEKRSREGVADVEALDATAEEQLLGRGRSRSGVQPGITSRAYVLRRLDFLTTGLAATF